MRLRKPTLLFLVVGLTASLTALASARCDTPQSSLDAASFSNDLHGALAHGGRVYIASVVALRPFGHRSNEFVEVGEVRLTVERTLHGEVKRELLLPYAFAKPRLKNTLFSPWPAVSEGQLVLCVILPNAVDGQLSYPSTQPIGDGAAARVELLQHVEDELIGEYEDIISLVKLSDDAFSKKAEVFLRDPRRRMKAYCLHAVRSRVAPSDPSGALALLKSCALSASRDKLRTTEVVTAISLISQVCRRYEFQRDAEIAALRTLLELVADCPGQRELVVQCASTVLSQSDVHWSEVMAIERRRSLMDTLRELRDSSHITQSLAVVTNWLEGRKGNVPVIRE